MSKRRIYEEPVKEPSVDKPKRRKRKPMTEEQRAAAAERLRLAREKKNKNKEDKSVHESIRNLPDDHYLHPKKVKAWLKVWTKHLSSSKKDRDSKNTDQRRAYQIALTYVDNMKLYLRTGIWCDSHYGERREHRNKFVVEAMAYNRDGTIKRTKGLYYRDIGLYTGDNG